MAPERDAAFSAIPPQRIPLYWGGICLQNPPIRQLLSLAGGEKPDEIWVIRPNPEARRALPRSLDEIDGRRHALAGNVPLEWELALIGTVNKLLARSAALGARYRHVAARMIELDRGGNHVSKPDRSPRAPRGWWERGERLAPLFPSDTSLRAI